VKVTDDHATYPWAGLSSAYSSTPNSAKLMAEYSARRARRIDLLRYTASMLAATVACIFGRSSRQRVAWI